MIHALSLGSVPACSCANCGLPRPQGFRAPFVRRLTVLAVALGLTPSARGSEPADGWRIRLEAGAAGVVDKGWLTLGSGSGALAGLDPYDEPHPPALPSRYVDVYTEHPQADPGWGAQLRTLSRYRREYFPALGSSRRVVEFVVGTDRSDLVRLTWTLTPDLDLASHFVTLTDLETATVVDVWTQAAYEFSPTGLVRRFRLEMNPGRSAPPIAFAQSATLPEDGSVALTLSAQDPEGDPLTYEIVAAPGHGVVTGTPPAVTYTPAANYFGSDSFSFRARDSQGASNVAQVSLVVTPVNDAPQALAQTVATDEDVIKTIALTGTDPDGDSLTYAVLQGPSHGVLEGTAPNLTYRPDPNFNGADSFSFAVSDGQVQSSAASVSLLVAPVNDPPDAAFTVPGPAHNVATWDSNVGSYFEGASATASSQATGSLPLNAIDDNLTTRWISASGQTTAQSLTVTLPHGVLHRVGRVRLVNPTSTDAVKHFEVRVSRTTLDESAFATILTDLALNSARVQEFPFPAPVDALYVQLRPLDNYGSPAAVSVTSFEVIADGLSGVPSYSAPTNVAAAAEGARVVSFTSQASGTPASQIIDGSASLRWASATGQRANQSVVVELAREKTYTIDRVRLVNPSGTGGQSVRNFSIGVSTSIADPGAFVDVLAATALDNTSVQEFALPGGPVPARFVRLIAVDNYGSTTGISLAELQVGPVRSGSPSVSSVEGLDRAENLLDSSSSTSWRSATGETVNQFVKLRLHEGREQLVDRVRLQPYAAATPEAMRDFEFLASTTTDADAAFTSILSGTLLNNGQPQEFVFPGGAVRARYVKLLARNNYGGTVTRLSTLEVVTVGTEGNVVSVPAPIGQVARNESPAQTAGGAVVLDFSSAFSLGTLPEQMLDHVVDFPWATTSTTGQFTTIRLATRSLLSGVRITPRADCCFDQSVKDFEVWVSDTTSEEASFARVLTGAVLNNATEQTFLFSAPTQARYLKYVPLTSHGSPTYIATGKFDVVVDGVDGVDGVDAWVASWEFPAAARPHPRNWPSMGTRARPGERPRARSPING